MTSERSYLDRDVVLAMLEAVRVTLADSDSTRAVLGALIMRVGALPITTLLDEAASVTRELGPGS